MRRWTGRIAEQHVDFRAISYEDDNTLSSLLAAQSDVTMESLANSLFNDHVVANIQTYVWITDGETMHGLNQRLQTHNTVGSNFLVSNHLQVVSVFIFITFGPTGHGLQPIR